MEKTGEQGSALAWDTSAHALVQTPPRLLELKDACRYCGVSRWVLRGWEAAGLLTRVRVPGPEGKDLDKILFDRTDIDRLIDSWKA